MSGDFHYLPSAGELKFTAEMPLLGAGLDLRCCCLKAEGAHPQLAGACWLACVSQVILELHDPLKHLWRKSVLPCALWNGQRSCETLSRQCFEQKRGAGLTWLMGRGGSRDSSRATVLAALCPSQGRAKLSCRPPGAEGHTPCPLALATHTNQGEHQEGCFETSRQISRPLESSEPGAEQRSRREVAFCCVLTPK